MLNVSISQPLGTASVEIVRKWGTIDIGMVNVSLCNIPEVTRGSHPQPLDANLEATICSLKHVGKPTGGNVVLVGAELAGRQDV